MVRALSPPLSSTLLRWSRATDFFLPPLFHSPFTTLGPGARSLGLTHEHNNALWDVHLYYQHHDFHHSQEQHSSLCLAGVLLRIFDDPPPSALPVNVTASNNTQLSAADLLKNGNEAQILNAQFESLNATSPCQSESLVLHYEILSYSNFFFSDGQFACVGSRFASCVNNTFVLSSCPDNLECVALPLVNEPGTVVTCDTTADALARIAVTNATGGLSGNGDNQVGDNNEDGDPRQ